MRIVQRFVAVLLEDRDRLVEVLLQRAAHINVKAEREVTDGLQQVREASGSWTVEFVIIIHSWRRAPRASFGTDDDGRARCGRRWRLVSRCFLRKVFLFLPPHNP
jgi:hypothetical protein